MHRADTNWQMQFIRSTLDWWSFWNARRVSGLQSTRHLIGCSSWKKMLTMRWSPCGLGWQRRKNSFYRFEYIIIIVNFYGCVLINSASLAIPYAHMNQWTEWGIHWNYLFFFSAAHRSYHFYYLCIFQALINYRCGALSISIQFMCDGEARDREFCMLVVVEFQQTQHNSCVRIMAVRVCGQENQWTFNDFITLDVIANRQTPKSVIVTEIVWIDSAGGGRNHMSDVYLQASLNISSVHESCSLHVQNKTEEKIEFIPVNWFGWIRTYDVDANRSMTASHRMIFYLTDFRVVRCWLHEHPS